MRRKPVAVPVAISLGGGLPVMAVIAGGYWRSPIVLGLLAVAPTAGIAWGWAAAARSRSRGAREAERRHSLALDRMAQLIEANELLVSLHRVAQSLPASLNLDQVLAATVVRLRSLIGSDVTVVLLRDEVTGGWTVRASDGVALPRSLSDGQLPGPLRAATTSSVASLVVCLAPGEGIGPGSMSRSGLYTPLRARGALVGLLALEHHQPGRYDRRDLRLLDGFAGWAALSIDNAGWFGRLRAMGADEERVRIARDIHDSVGQSLAYLAFKLDRVTPMAQDKLLRQELEGLRREVRGVVTEVRDALSDLRTDVTDEQGLVETLEAFLDRVRARGSLEVVLQREADGRLPLVQERELWRIAHEAISNVEHHARAGHLWVRWECDGQNALLAVADDGRGFPLGWIGRSDSYGITGMRERAGAIGAQLKIESEPFVGTLVECRLGWFTGGIPTPAPMGT
jgi:signal transduction histidine kinase